MKDNIKILKFLYEKKIEGANFCFIGGDNLGVKNWNNIPSYNSHFDLFKNTGINDNKIINQLIINGYLERGKSLLTISITNKGIIFYENEKNNIFGIKSIAIQKLFYNPYIVGFIVTIVGGLILGIILYNLTNDNSKKPNTDEKIYISENVGQIAIGDNNNLIQNKLPTETEEKQQNQWEDCETTLRALFRRLNRNDFDFAYSLFDKYLKESKYFSVKNLENFKNNFVNGDLEIWEINRKFIDNSIFVARCEFDFKLRYINKNDGKDKIEIWKGVVLKNKDEVDIFQIGELKCLDKKCENNPLFN